MKNLALIPARSGSKRIKDKNIKPFDGTPLLKSAIEKANKSNLFETVHVSTDSEIYAELAVQWGADASFIRSETNSDDFATTLDVIKEVHQTFKEAGSEFSHIFCLYCTSPFVEIQQISESYEVLKRGFDTVFAVTEFDFPPQRAFYIDGGKIAFVDPALANARSQDLEPRLHDAGQFYWLKTEEIDKRNTLITQNTGYYHLDPIQCQDIDTPDDWEIAEFKYEYLKRSKRK